jgi:single-strand DNA-binding protein
MYNKIILAGNLTRDVEVRYTQSGSAIGNTAIATSRKFKSATGEQKEEVLFVDLTFFGRTAEIANQYLRKGSKVLVDGRLKLDQWTAQDGSKRSKHSVTVENLQMLGSKDEAQGGYNATPAGDTYSQPAPSQPAPQAATQQEQASNIPEIDINEDEIPF